MSSDLINFKTFIKEMFQENVTVITRFATGVEQQLKKLQGRVSKIEQSLGVIQLESGKIKLMIIKVLKKTADFFFSRRFCD